MKNYNNEYDYINIYNFLNSRLKKLKKKLLLKNVW